MKLLSIYMIEYKDTEVIVTALYYKDCEAKQVSKVLKNEGYESDEAFEYYKQYFEEEI